MKKTINIPIYGGKLTIIQTDDFKKISSKYGVKIPEKADALAIRQEVNGIEYVLVFESKTTMPIIAHECLHIANYILYDSNITLDPHNDETQCYLLEWIVGNVVKHICN